MNSKLLKYNFGDKVCAFTTKRTLGRDKERICSMLGIDTSRFVMPHQTHQDVVQVVREVPMEKEELEGKDAIMTNLKGVLIGVSTADCIPVLLYDKENNAIAAVHAGWKGTVKRIVEKSILRMQEVYGTKPEMLKAVIGPGISQRRFEVGDEVYDVFQEEFVTEVQCFSVRTNKWHLDLKECNRLQLLKVGVKEENIEVSPVCTYDDTEYFSARREQKGDVKCGRNFNAIMLI